MTNNRYNHQFTYESYSNNRNLLISTELTIVLQSNNNYEYSKLVGTNSYIKIISVICHFQRQILLRLTGQGLYRTIVFNL